ncbi:MAG: HEAT repeat domain-containing protein, partial [Myxococcota bacterium]
LNAAVAVTHPKVRRAVVTAMGEFRTKKAATRLTERAREDESLLVASSAARALGATRQPEAFEVLEQLLDRDSWADVLRAGALGGLANLRDERGVELIRQRTRYGIPNRGRRAAVMALAKLASGRRAREHLEDMLSDADPYLRVTVVDAIAELGDVRARAALRRQLERDLDGRVRRRIRETLLNLSGRHRKEMRRLEDEVERLERHVQELTVRITKLEAKKKV